MADSKTKLIAGEEFTISQPYAEGHTLTAAEARAMNQLRSENIGNNMRKAVEKAKEEGKSIDEIRTFVGEYEAAYSFAMPGAGGGSRTLDPVEREARRLAKEVVSGRIRELYGIGLSGIHPDYKELPEEEAKAKSKERFDGAIEAVASKEEVIAQAKKNVNAKKKAAESATQDLGL